MATTNPSHAVPRGWTADAGETTNRWSDIWRPATVSRLAGLCALAQVAIAFVPLGGNYHADLPAAQVVTWASQHQQAIWADGFLSGLSNTLFALQLVLLVALTMNRGILASIARVGAAAALATGWAKVGIEYALADLAHRGGADAGVLALFSLVKTMDYTDGMSIGLAIAAVSVLLLRRQALPRPVLWLGLLLAAELIAAMPIQLAVMGTGNGPQGPLSVVLGLLWLLVIGIVLLVKPVRLPEAASADVQTAA